MEVADFISPVGLLTAALFPGQNLEAMVSAWLTEAETRAAAAATVEQQTEAVKSWVYHRAYFDVWQRLSSNPASLSLDGTSYGMGQEQIAAYLNLANGYLDSHHAAMGLVKGKPIVSRSTKTVATW